MQGKVTLEDHFAIEDTLGDSQPFGAHVWAELRHRLLDFQDQRLRLMDASGVEIMIASLNAPAIQAIRDPKQAAQLARRANDALAAEIAKRPDRFVGVAALPMQEAQLATQELERCIKDLGFKGALVNGYSQTSEPNRVLHYDLPEYRLFWRAVENLGIPFYLHPRPPSVHSALYEGHPWLFGPTWTFAAETSVHALRLIGSGLFDEHPRLQIILGHLGEGLPYYLWRIDNRNNWMKAPHKYAARKPVAAYFRANFYLTTSGHFSTPALVDAIAEIGPERVMFSVDYPFEDFSDAADWFDQAPITETDRRKIGRTNAMRLFKLPEA
ncbi:MAG TPA: amidohydrolase family protein [Xanthobacteraceae bacterium]|nr:amidohydrolase family protein [Xanthobacteraceae bacterium]